jgi:hypothetical protein
VGRAIGSYDTHRACDRVKGQHPTIFMYSNVVKFAGEDEVIDFRGSIVPHPEPHMVHFTPFGGPLAAGESTVAVPELDRATHR